MEVKLIPIDQIVEDPDQPRRGYDEESLQGLAESIRRYGLINPITVRLLPDGETYQIITGERRWRAAQRAGLTEIPCIVKSVTPTP
jgi:ParB family chromosome partitioning protein